MRPVSAVPPGALLASPSQTGPAGHRPAGGAGTRPTNRADSRRPASTDRVSALAKGFVSLFLEVEAGCRPRGQLAPFMTPMLFARLSEVWVRGGSPGSVVLARVAARTDTACDVVVIVRRGARWGAVSLRLSAGRRGWLVDDIALPERGPLPLPPYPVPSEEPDPDDDLSLVPLPHRGAGV